MNLGRFLFAAGVVVLGAAMAAGAGCSVSTGTTTSTGTGIHSTSPSSSNSSGTAGGSTAQSSSMSSSASGMCTDMMGCKKCNACKLGCGEPSNPAAVGLCDCNGNGMGNDSFSLYKSYFDCLCGTDGMSGKCGSQCAKTCTGQGTDGDMCMMCLSGAIAGTCSMQFQACSADM